MIEFTSHGAVESGRPSPRLPKIRVPPQPKQHLKLDLESCEGCGGQVRVIACIEDPAVIGKILQHLEKTGTVLAGGALLPEARGPPQGLLDLN